MYDVFAILSCGIGKRRSSAAPLQSCSIINFQFLILHFHFQLHHASTVIFIIAVYRHSSHAECFCQFYHFADVSKMVGNSHPSNGKRANELKYCFNNHSWALSLIMAWR